MALPVEPAASPPTGRYSLQFEAWLAVGLIGFGLFVLPALIYATGSLLLGAYGGGEHIGSFYGDFFRDLGATPQTWGLVLGPYVLVQLARLIFRDTSESEPPAASCEPARSSSASAPRERREPTIKL